MGKDVSFSHAPYFEQFRLVYKKIARTISRSRLQEKDMSFTVNEDKTITRINSVWNGVTHDSTFRERAFKKQAFDLKK